MNKTVVAAVLIMLSGNVTAQVYKCVANGRTSFSDSPCPANANEEKITLPDYGSAEARTSAPPTAADVSRDFKLRRIDSDIEDKENEIQQNIQAMENEISKLKEDSDKVGDNKLNALWKEILAEEMQAVAAKYMALNSNLQNSIDALRAERRILAMPSVSKEAIDKANALIRSSRLRRINLDIQYKEDEIQQNIRAMQNEISQLKTESDKVGDNKLNALWKEALASEMKAVTKKYQTINSALQYQVDALRSERQLLSR